MTLDVDIKEMPDFSDAYRQKHALLDIAEHGRSKSTEVAERIGGDSTVCRDLMAGRRAVVGEDKHEAPLVNEVYVDGVLHYELSPVGIKVVQVLLSELKETVAARAQA